MIERDPRAIIRNGPMTPFQIGVVTLCVLIAGLDGFDVLVIAYTAPSIVHEWGLAPTDLGIIFGAGVLGMALGNAFVAPIGDKVGRKPIAIVSLAILALGMFASALARNSGELAVLRVVTGIGIGTALANVNVIVAEYASDGRRSLSISLMTIGYPAGATLGGFLSIFLISNYGWRSVYLFGALLAVVLAVPASFWMPESIDYLLSRRPVRALARINRIMRHLRQPAISDLPENKLKDERQDTSLLAVFHRPYLASTVAASLAYFGTTFTVFFLLNWIPKILTELGFSISGGISVSLVMNVAGMVGCLLFGLLAKPVGPRRLAAVFMAGLFATTAIFGMTSAGAAALTATTVLIGGCLFTSMTALYVIVPAAFPSTVRSTGTGVTMSIGRIGAMMGPFVAGVLISNGWSRAAYCLVLGAPALLAALCLYWVRALDEVLPSPAAASAKVQLAGAAE